MCGVCGVCVCVCVCGGVGVCVCEESSHLNRERKRCGKYMYLVTTFIPSTIHCMSVPPTYTYVCVDDKIKSSYMLLYNCLYMCIVYLAVAALSSVQ